MVVLIVGMGYFAVAPRLNRVEQPPLRITGFHHLGLCVFFWRVIHAIFLIMADRKWVKVLPQIRSAGINRTHPREEPHRGKCRPFI